MNTDQNPDITYTVPASLINKIKICCPTYLFSFWTSVRQWWKVDSLTPSFEFRYLCFIRHSNLVCTIVINCPHSLGARIFVCANDASLKTVWLLGGSRKPAWFPVQAKTNLTSKGKTIYRERVRNENPLGTCSKSSCFCRSIVEFIQVTKSVLS